MNLESMHIGQRVRHPQHGMGTVKGLTEHAAEIHFDDGVRRSVAPAASGLEPGEATARVAGLDMPLAHFIRQTVQVTAESLGLAKADDVVEKLGARWQKGRLVLHPANPALQAKEVEIEVFFHKLTMVRNNLRVLEQKINASEALSSADKFDWQQYITRCYGSLTTFNVLFKDKEDWF